MAMFRVPTTAKEEYENFVARRRFVWTGNGLLFLIFIVFFFTVTGLGTTVLGWLPLPRDPTEIAKSGAKQLVREQLRAPATASVPDVTILERSGDYFPLQVTADAQNVFGATLRDHFLVVLRVRAGSTGKFSHYEFAAQGCHNPPLREEIVVTKSLNHWGE